jgi:hypothetical protein
MLQHEVEHFRLFGQRPGNEATADLSIAGFRELAREPFDIAITAPISPSPPAAETAAASRPPAANAIGADMIGCSMSRISVNRVRKVIQSCSSGKGPTEQA